MLDNQHLIEKLEKLLVRKKSKAYYAEQLDVSEEEIDALLERIRARNDAESAYYIGKLEDAVVSFQENVEKGTGEVVFSSPEEIRTLDQLIEKCNIDVSTWDIVKYIQNYWGNAEHPHWQVKAWLSKKKPAALFQQTFIEFLSTYSPPPKPETFRRGSFSSEDNDDACLVINKQDAHYNKYDVYGNNVIEDRFENVREKVEKVIMQAVCRHHLQKTIYVIGSDEFNSEFNSTTTKGTPQENIRDYHNCFRKICNHETWMIDMFLEYSDEVEVIYVPGNHDEFVGWHIIHWLTAYYKDNSKIVFDDSPRYRKYISYGNTAMMFNHGDTIKPQNLATMFPAEYKEKWSQHDNFYVFTGDKHHEVTQSFNGIKFFQIPAFSSAKSQWDDRNGYTCVKGEVSGFLIDEKYGMTNIYKQPL